MVRSTCVSVCVCGWSFPTSHRFSRSQGSAFLLGCNPSPPLLGRGWLVGGRTAAQGGVESWLVGSSTAALALLRSTSRISKLVSYTFRDEQWTLTAYSRFWPSLVA